MNRGKALGLIGGVLLMSLAAFGNKSTRGFEALEIYNYFKAKKLFEKAYKRDTCSAAYGLSIIYFRSDNPFTDRDTALHFVLESERAFLNLPSRKRIKYAPYGLDSNAIQEQKQRIAYWNFSEAIAVGTSLSMQQFVDEFEWFEKIDSAKRVRNTWAFDEASAMGTAEAMKEFLEKYPESKYSNEAKRILDQRQYLEYTITGAISDYELFIKRFPKSSFLHEAMDSVFSKCTIEGSPSSYYKFVKQHPDYYNVNRAWESLYRLEVVHFTPTEITEFMLRYPEYPKKSRALEDSQLAKKSFWPYQDSNGLWGYIDTSGAVVIPANFQSVSPFVNGLAIVSRSNSVGFINKKGTEVVPLKYTDAEPFSQGVAVVELQGKYGLVSRSGREIVSPMYADLGSASNNVCYAANEQGYGFISLNGEVAIGFKFISAGDMRNGYAIVRNSSGVGVVDSVGSFVIQPDFEWIGPEQEGLFRVKANQLFGVLGVHGDTVLKPDYRFVGDLKSGRRLVVKEGSYGYLDSAWKLVVPFVPSEDASLPYYANFDNNAVKVKRNGLYGLNDTLGKKLFPAIFEDIGLYGDELTAVKRYGKWGYANQRTKLKINYRFDHAREFKADVAIVGSNGLFGVINTEGDVVVPIEQNEIRRFGDTLLLLVKDSITTLTTVGMDTIFSRSHVRFSIYDEENSVALLVNEKGERQYLILSNRRLFGRKP